MAIFQHNINQFNESSITGFIGEMYFEDTCGVIGIF